MTPPPDLVNRTARRAAPDAIQVADRRHLRENCSRALPDVVQRRRSDVRAAGQPAATETGSAQQPPSMISAVQRRWARWRRQHEAYDEAVRPNKEGVSINAIVRRLGVRRNTVRRWLHGAAPDLFRCRLSLLEPHYARLERRWADGCHNGAQLWRELRNAGFRGGLRAVTEWATRQRLAGRPGRSMLSFTTSPLRCVARLLTAEPAALVMEERHYFDRLLAISAPLARAHELALRFAAIVRERKTGDLDRWVADATESEVRFFANRLRQDEAAIRTALELPWNNG